MTKNNFNSAAVTKIFKTFPNCIHWVFAVIALAFGLIFMHMMPPLWGVDEASHFARAYQASVGEVMAQKLHDGSYGGAMPASFGALDAQVAQDVPKIRHTDPYFQRNDVPNRSALKQAAALPLQRGGKSVAPFSNTAVYSPLAYVGAVGGLWVAELLHTSIGTAVELARFGTLVVYILFSFAALRLLSGSRLRWLVFTIALLPMCVFQAAMVNVDSLDIGASLLLFALYVRLLKGAASRTLLIALALTGAMLALTKVQYAVLLAPIIFLPGKLWRSRSREWVYKAAVLIVAVGIAALWTYSVRDIAKAVPMSQGPRLFAVISPTAQMHYVIHAPLAFAKTVFRSMFVNDTFWFNGIFGQFGWDVLFLPVSVVLVLMALLVLATFYENDRIVQPKAAVEGGVFTVTALGTALGIILTLYLMWTPVFSPIVGGVQGRYFIPGLVFLLYGLRRLLPIRVEVRPPVMFGVLTTVLVVCLAFTTYFCRAVL